MRGMRSAGQCDSSKLHHARAWSRVRDPKVMARLSIAALTQHHKTKALDLIAQTILWFVFINLPLSTIICFFATSSSLPSNMDALKQPAAQCAYCKSEGYAKGLDDYGHIHCQMCRVNANGWVRNRSDPATGEVWSVYCDSVQNSVNVRQVPIINRDHPAIFGAPDDVFRLVSSGFKGGLKAS